MKNLSKEIIEYSKNNDPIKTIELIITKLVDKITFYPEIEINELKVNKWYWIIEPCKKQNIKKYINEKFYKKTSSLFNKDDAVVFISHKYKIYGPIPEPKEQNGPIV